MLSERIGISLWNWIPVFTERDISLIEHVASLGFGVVEIGMDLLDFDHKKVGQIAKSLGITIDLCGAFTKGRDLSNFDPSIRESTKKYVIGCLNAAEEMGSKLFVGPVYAGGGKAHLLPPEEKKREWDFAVEGLKEITHEAMERGVTIGLEPINRYRTSVINTVQEALCMIAEVDSPALGILFDTYQANIEESNMQEALDTACRAHRLVHFHASENHRGPPGSGHIDWDALFSVLATSNYRGHIVMEIFAPGGLDAPWTQSIMDPDVRASSGLAFLSNLMKRHRL